MPGRANVVGEDLRMDFLERRHDGRASGEDEDPREAQGRGRIESEQEKLIQT